MINLTTVISIRLNLGTIRTGMSYEITYADGRIETQPHTPALQAFLTAQGWIARRDNVLDIGKNGMERRR